MRMGMSRSLQARTTAFHVFASADVAGVDPEAVEFGFSRHEGKSVIEVDVGHERRVGTSADVLEGGAGVLVGHRQPDDVAAVFHQPLDLRHGGIDVARVGDGHRLDRNRCAPTDRHVPHFDLVGPASA